MAYFQSRRRREYPGDVLRPNAFDRASSLLVALLTLVGVIVLVLFGLWAAPQKPDEWVMTYQPKLVDAVPAEEEPVEFETPSPDELPGIPLLQTPELFAADIAESMATVSVTQDEGLLLDQAGRGAPGGFSGGFVCRSRSATEYDPRLRTERRQWERWEIRFATASLEEYASQLDYFDIELAAAGGGKQNLDYAKGFTTSSPSVRQAPGAEDQRLYMSWRDEPYKTFDNTLLERAGISVDGRITVQFYSPEVVELLATEEARYAAKRPVEQIQKTIFGVRPAADGYEFFVESQSYR